VGGEVVQGEGAERDQKDWSRGGSGIEAGESADEEACASFSLFRTIRRRVL